MFNGHSAWNYHMMTSPFANGRSRWLVSLVHEHVDPASEYFLYVLSLG